MAEFREVTRDERRQMLSDGTFDINGNMPFHPGYTGIHQLGDGKFVFRRPTGDEEITDPQLIGAIEWRLARNRGENVGPPPGREEPEPTVETEMDVPQASTRKRWWHIFGRGNAR